MQDIEAHTSIVTYMFHEFSVILTLENYKKEIPYQYLASVLLTSPVRLGH